ncbi:MAG TPA: NADH-quinone oxidoreductase subunit M [Candidatus Micrarchaeia archaeon]|nr:NADH-quinone oxidoreductase subunit M [Candidatus Micrarchaeia archaeon]
MSWPILTVVLLLPLAGAITIALIPADRRRAIRAVSISTTAATLGLAVVLLVAFYALPNPSSSRLSGSVQGQSLHQVLSPITFQFQEQVGWLGSLGNLGAAAPTLDQGNNTVDQAAPPPINFTYHLGADGLSVWLVALAALLFLIAALALRRREGMVRSFAILMCVSEVGVLGVLLSLDLVLFYFFWEAALIPLYFLLLGFGGERRGPAALKFMIYTVAGSLFMLLAILGAYFIGGAQTGIYTFDLPTQILIQTSVHASHPTTLTLFGHVLRFLTPQQWLFCAFALAFAIKIPLVPLHTWLPDAYESGSTAFLVFFAGIVSKLGAFGFIRYCLPLFPGPSHTFQPVLMALGVTSILYGALMALREVDLKRTIGYASISHLGFIVLGIFSLDVDGLNGAILQMVNHGVIICGLFLCAGMLEARFQTRDRRQLAGLAGSMPVFAGLFLVIALAGLGMPLLSSFVGEFLTLLGAFEVAPAWAVAAGLGTILACWYMLRLYQGVMQGRAPAPGAAGQRDLGPLEVALLAPLVALIAVIGVFPEPVIHDTRFSANQYIIAADRGVVPTPARPAARRAARPAALPAARPDAAVSGPPVR